MNTQELKDLSYMNSL